MKSVLSTLLICFFFSFSNAQEQDSISRKNIYIQKVEISPKIDGILDDIAWESTEIATNFVERSPNNGKAVPDSIRTEVKIVYDNLGIYFGAKMFDPAPEKIRRELTERDNLGNDDFFFVLLNGYNDRQQSLQFIVTAAGVQYDAKMTNQNEDPSWNGVWYSSANITDFGWVAEMFIPYSELRFPEKDIQVWGLNMEREFRRTGTRSSWSPVDNSKGSYSLYDGEIYGIKNIETPTRLSFQPYLSTYVNNYDGNSEVNFNGGLDLKYGINDAFTLDMILIPDFGQTKFDEAVLNLSAIETQYEEQRSFFTEGTELFSKGELFYSRRIGGAPNFLPELGENESIDKFPASVDLINALKISGRTKNGLGIGFFNAITEKTYAEVKNLETGETRKALVAPFSNYNVLVLDQRFGDNSSVSFVNTNVLREGNFQDANATGLYTNLNNRKNTMNYWLNLEGSWVMNQNTKFGTDAQLGLANTSGKHIFQGQIDFRTRDYDINDMGYSSLTNYIRYIGAYAYRILQPKKGLYNLRLNFNIVHERRLEPDLYSNLVFNFNSSFTTKNFFNFGGGFETTPFGTQDFYEPRVEGWHVDIPVYYDSWLYFGTDYRKDIYLEGTIDWYKYDEKGRGQLELEFAPSFRVSDKFSLGLESNVVLSDKEEGFVNFLNDDIIFGERDRNTFVNSLSAKYIFSNKMGLNLAFRHYLSDVVYDEYFTLDPDGGLSELNFYNNIHDTTYNSWNIDLRYSWWFAPGSQVTLLYRNAIESFLNAGNQDFSRNFDYLFDQPQVNSISLRISYYLDYNRMKNWFDSSPSIRNEKRDRKMGK